MALGSLEVVRKLEVGQCGGGDRIRIGGVSGEAQWRKCVSLRH
jgi:hypothetical protein